MHGHVNYNLNTMTNISMKISLVLSAILLTAFASINSPVLLEMDSISSSCRNEPDNSINVTLSCTFSCFDYLPWIKLFNSFNLRKMSEFIFYSENRICSGTTEVQMCRCNAENIQSRNYTYIVHGAITAQARIEKPCLYSFECHSQNVSKEKSFTFEDCAMMQPNICGTSATTNISSDLYLESTPNIVVVTVEPSPTSCPAYNPSTVRLGNCTLCHTVLQKQSVTPLCTYSKSVASGNSYTTSSSTTTRSMSTSTSSMSTSTSSNTSSPLIIYTAATSSVMLTTGISSTLILIIILSFAANIIMVVLILKLKSKINQSKPEKGSQSNGDLSVSGTVIENQVELNHIVE